MGVLGRKSKEAQEAAEAVVHQLTPELQEALIKLDDDLRSLLELLQELTETQRAVARQLRAEVEVPVLPAPGVEVFTEGPSEPFPSRKIVPSTTEERESPFRRAPRKVQIAWLREVMGDGQWHSAFAIADRYATDERHRRYMRGAVSGRLREMYEDGEVERRDSPVRGSMYEYRQKGKP